MGLEDVEVFLAKCVISISDVFDGLGEIRRQKCESKCCESPILHRLSCPLFFHGRPQDCDPLPWSTTLARRHLGRSMILGGTGETIEVNK